MERRFALTGARVFDGGSFQEGLAVIVEGSLIADVVPGRKCDPRIEQRALGGGILSAGFIDIQVNGGGGVLFNAEPSPEGVRKIARAHRRYGSTGLLPTVVTDAPQVLRRALSAVEAVRADGERAVLGIHVEGPFLDVRRKGAHAEQFIRQISAADVAELVAAKCGRLLVTLAPNRVQPHYVAELAKAGILVSLGHAEATAEEAQAALDAGASAFTHLYNAMSQLDSRAPGMVGAALANGKCYCSLIADGHHVHNLSLRVAMAAKPRDRSILITDAMPSAAGGPDSFLLQNREVKLRGGRLELEEGTLAGSNLTMDGAVRYCVKELGVEPEQALRMATSNPANFLGMGGELGRIAPGYLASLVHLSDDLQVLQTWVEGQ